MSDTSKARRLNFLTLRSLLAASLAAIVFVILATVEARAGAVVREAQAPPASDDGAVTFLPPQVGAQERVVRVRFEGLPEAAAVDATRVSSGRVAVAWELLGQGGERRAEVTTAERGELRLKLAGEWRKAKELVLHRVSAAGERLRPVPGSERLSLEKDGEVVVRLERAPRTSLVVRNDATGELVQRWDLKVQREDRLLGAFDVEVSSSAIVDDVTDSALARSVDWIACGPTPVELEPLVSAETGLGERVKWDIEAVGFADCSISVALDSGGVHELRLAPIASANVRWQVPDALLALARDGQLRLALLLDPADPYAVTDELAGAASPPSAVQVLRAPASESFLPTFGTDERGPCYRITLTGLPAGEHELRLDRKRVGLVERRELASARFVAAPGQRATVELETSSGALELPSTLGFDFVIPAEYGNVLRSTLTLQRIVERKPGRSLTEVEFDSKAGRSAPVTLSAGSYELVLSGGLNFRTLIVVGAGVSERRRIELPPLSRFRVRFVADGGGDDGLPEAFPWSACFGDKTSRDFIAICEKGKPGTFELSSPSDQIELRPPRQGSIRFASGATVRLSGGGEHIVPVIRSPRARLQLVRDGRRVAIPLGLRVLQRVCVDPPRGSTDDPPPQRVTRPVPGAPEELQLWFSAAGTYELHFSTLEGYAPLPRLRVRVVEHDDLAIEVKLEPTR